MTTTKYAIDLTGEDSIIDRRSGRLVLIDNIEEAGFERLLVSGYFEDDGTDWTRTLDFDSQVKVVD